jgi:hypothetical protein
MSNYHLYENGLIFNQTSLKEKNEKPVEILISNPKINVYLFLIHKYNLSKSKHSFIPKKYNALSF